MGKKIKRPEKRKSFYFEGLQQASQVFAKNIKSPFYTPNSAFFY